MKLYKVRSGERLFSISTAGSQLFTSAQGTSDHGMLSKSSNVGEERFELVANPGEVGINRFRANIVAHIDGVKTESVDCRFNGETMGVAKRNIRVEC